MTADDPAPTEAEASLEPASDAESIAFAQRLRRGPAMGARLREGFWASLLGAGVVVWSFGMELAITNAGFVDRRWEATWLAAGCLAGLTIGVFVGFRRPLGGYGSLVRRTLLVIALGGMLAGAMVVLALLVNEAAGRSRASASAGMMAALGLAAMAGAAARFGWLRFDLEAISDDELPTARRRRLGAFGALAAAALVSLVSASDTARCLLGSAQACAAVADDASHGGDPSGRLDYVRRGCLHGDAALCRQAGDLALRGVGAPPDRREAERLLRHGCTLDGSACRELHVLELESSCAAKHAFACLELAPEVARGTLGPPNPPRAADLRTKACLLGLDEACSR